MGKALGITRTSEGSPSRLRFPEMAGHRLVILGRPAGRHNFAAGADFGGIQRAWGA